MTSPQTYTALFEEKFQHNQKFIQFSFELIEPHRIEFQAGQYLSLKINDRGERRSYSICSPPDIDHQVDLVVDLSPAGKGSQFLQNLEFGSEVKFLAPMGSLVVPPNLSAEQLVFVATGAGIAPFKAMIEDQLRNQHNQRPLILHWGMRHAEDLFWLDEFEALTQIFANFFFHPVLSQAVDSWTLCRGHVTDCLSIHDQPQHAAYFLCGGQAMIKDVNLLLEQQGVAPSSIFTEKFC